MDHQGSYIWQKRDLNEIIKIIIVETYFIFKKKIDKFEAVRILMWLIVEELINEAKKN